MMTTEAADSLCQTFNEVWPIGTEVWLIKDLGERVRTKTRSTAYVSATGHPVIFLCGIPGYWLLERVIPIPGETNNVTN